LFGKSRGFNNDACLSFLSHACKDFFDATHTLVSGLEEPIEPRVHFSSVSPEIVKELFSQLIGGFCDNNSIFQVEASFSLMRIGDDSIHKIIAFLSFKGLRQVVNVSRLFCKLAKPNLHRYFSVYLSRDYSLMHGYGSRPIFNSKFSSMDGSLIENLDLSVCCLKQNESTS
jgi:hypothetical protein